MHNTTIRSLTLFAALFAASTAVANPEAADLHTWGKLAPVRKTDFFQLTYKELDGRKRKTRKAFVKLADSANFYLDRSVSLEQLEAGADVWIYGNPQERSSQTDDGRTQIDRQIVNTLVIATGDALTVNAEAPEGPAGQKWLKASVSRVGQGLHVSYEGQDYKVVCLKGYAVLHRTALDEAPKLSKKLMVEVAGLVSEDKPEKAKDDDRAFSATHVVVLDKRLQRVVYPLLLP
jgi:hypothetical protein